MLGTADRQRKRAAERQPGRRKTRLKMEAGTSKGERRVSRITDISPARPPLMPVTLPNSSATRGLSGTPLAMAWAIVR